MAWHYDSITPGELDALREAARRAWADDSRLERLAGLAPDVGQCYVTANWLVSRLGGQIGSKEGHFAWISSDQRYAIDLTGDHRDQLHYGPNEGYKPFALVENERTARFSKRADLVFDNLDRLLYLADLAGADAYPAEEPQALDDKQISDSYWHDEPAGTDFDPDYNFVYANGQLEVSPNHGHDELSGHIGIDPGSHTGPFAAGHITVINGKATWEVSSNVNAKALMRVFKDYSKRVGWQWGGLTNMGGEPIDDEFAPQKTSVLRYAYAGEHLFLGRTSHSELLLKAPGDDPLVGTVRISGTRAEIHPIHIDALPSLFEWAADTGLVLYAGNDNVIKTIPTLMQDNTGLDDEPRQDTNPFFDKRVDEREPTGVYRCPSCDRLFPGWNEYQRHRRDEEPEGDQVEDGKFPQLNPDAPTPFEPHFTPLQPDAMAGMVAAVLPSSVRVARRVAGFSKYAQTFGYDNDDYDHFVAFVNGSPVGYASVSKTGHIQMVQSAVQRKGVARALMYKVMRYYSKLSTNTMYDWEGKKLRRLGWVNTKGQLWKWAAGQSPSQTLEAPIPFIYDVQEDNVTVGQAGSRTSDIPGRFTPGGIVEGTYEPGGKILVRTMTSIPYTVRHLVQLWYYQHPELEVKSVHLQDDAGKDTRLAALPALLASFPAAWEAHEALVKAGGEVYIVGGAVRDALMDIPPKDMDLMVRGLPPIVVKETIERLAKSRGGSIKVTGKDFAVQRFNYAGDEVEVALPRRDRSTGPGYMDFEVQSNYTMEPEEDLKRRDFTINAMAYRIATGRFIDPFGGASDIASGTLRATSETTLSEDPLRVVRGLIAHARFGFQPDERTRADMAKNAHSLKYLPAERIQVELDKLMESPAPAEGIRFAHETGVLEHILPEVEACFGYDQKNPHHAHDLGTHLLEVLRNMTELTEDIDLRYAALLHDIGKPASAWWHPVDKRQKFYEFVTPKDLVGVDEVGTPHTIIAGERVGHDHHKVGAVMARYRLNELRFSKERTARITEIIRWHMFGNFASKKAARKFLSKVEPHADDLLLFRVADREGKGTPDHQSKLTPVEKMRRLVAQVREAGEATEQADLVIDGHDVLAHGIPNGPMVGNVLRHLTSAVIEDPELNTREQLLGLIHEYGILHAS